jgi:hypothetical protein
MVCRTPPRNPARTDATGDHRPSRRS